MHSSKKSAEEATPGTQRQCGPTLFLSLLVVIVVAFLALFLFHQGGETTGHKPAGSSMPEKMSTQTK